jgi:hypothetical protein
MATITTTSQTAVFCSVGKAAIARDQGTSSNAGYLYTVVRTGTDTLTCYRSTDNGGSWAAFGAFTHTGLQEWGSLVVDGFGYGHLMYRIGTGSADSVWYRRIRMDTGTWYSGFQASATDSNGGSISSRWQGVDCAVYRLSNNDRYVAWVGGYSNGNGQQGAALGVVKVTASGTVTSAHGTLISGNRFWLAFTSGRQGPAIEIEHSGNGSTMGTNSPNLWVSFGRTKLLMVKLGWNGNGWNGVSNATALRSSMGVHDNIPGRWDGTRWMQAIVNPDDTTTVLIYQRNQANTSTTTLTTPVHPTGVVRYIDLSYDATSKDLRVYAMGTSSDVLYYVSYSRATGTWGSWATVLATAVLNGSRWSIRRGGSSGNSKYDVVTAHSGSPNTITHTAQAVTNPPSISSFVLSGKPYVNGGPADVGAALSLSWTFTDTDPGETQGFYALSRQIGAGTVQYWNAGSSTWGASEVQNASTTQGVTLASGWGVDADAAYQYKVKVWDSSGIPAAGYSTALTLVPSAVSNPTVTAPTNASTLTTSRVTVTWTSTQQTGARIILAETSPNALTRFDSGPMMGYTDLDFEVPYEMPTGTSWQVTLYTYNNEGLPSNPQVRTFSVAYAPPPAPLSTFVSSTALGTITVTPAALAPVGTQPSIVGAQLYRRPLRFPERLANPSITSTTGYVGTGGTMTLSAVQVRDGTNSLRLVPDGVTAQPRVQVPAASAVSDAGLVSDPWIATGWIRPDTANKPIIIGLVYYDVSNAELGTVLATYSSVVAGAWHYVQVTGNAQAFPSAVKVGMRIGLGSTPAAGDAFYADLLSLRPLDTETAGVRVLNELGTPPVYADWGAASGIAYEYQWQVQGSNDTTQVGPWVS